RKQDDDFLFGFMIFPRKDPDKARLNLNQIKLRIDGLAPDHQWVLKSEYRINRAGQLLALNVALACDIDIPLLKIDDVKVKLGGFVREGLFYSTLRAKVRDQHLSYSFDPVPVSHSGSVLNPLHPVNKIKGLRAGQSWRMPMIDPLTESISAVRRLLGN